MGHSPRLKVPTNMKSLALLLCLSAAAALASPVETDDCSDCVNHCKTVKKIKYIEECETEKTKACEKFWKEDGYGGKVWTEDPSKCHWLQESDCTQVPHPVKDCKDVWEEVCKPVHKNVPVQNECQVCGGVERSCKKLDTKYYGH